MLFIVLTAASFSLLGFILGIWADNFEKLSVVPMLLITPLVFLGGSFYSTDMLPPLWQSISLMNPVLYLVSGLRWSFYEIAEVNVLVSLASITAFMLICLAAVYGMFKTGYKLRS
jgi:ABC-2 type transport system permease protein